MSDGIRWKKTYTYYEEPGAYDMVHTIVEATIKRAKDEGKIDRILKEPVYISHPALEEGYFKVIVTFEFAPGENFKSPQLKPSTKLIGIDTLQ